MSRSRFYLLFALAALVGCVASRGPARYAYRYHYGPHEELISVDVVPEVWAPRPCWGDIADCERTTPQRKLGSFVVPGQTNPWLSQGQYYWDPSLTAPATACASDGNNCTSSTCGAAGSGIGPCATYAGIMTRLGASQTYTWAINAPMVITALSGTELGSSLSTAAREPVSANLMTNPVPPATAFSLYAGFGAGAVLTINGVPSVASTTGDGGTGVLAGVVAKSRATNTPLSFTFPTGSYVTGVANSDGGGYVYNNGGQLLFNSTRNSYAIALPTAFAQPLKYPSSAVLPKPGNASLPTEDDTWANGDSFTLYNLPGVNLTELLTYNGGCLTNEQCGIAVDKVSVPVQYNANGGDDTLIIDNHVSIFNSVITKIIKLRSDGNDLMHNGLYGVAFTGGFSGGAGVFSKGLSDASNIPKGYEIFGGGTGNNVSAARNCVFDGVVLDADVSIAAPNCRFDSYNYSGAVYLTGVLIGVRGGLLNTGKTTLFANDIWGTGTLDSGEGTILYKSGAGGAASNVGHVGSGGALNIMGGTVGCLGIPTVATPTLTCNKTLSATNLDTDLGATSGCYWVEGGGSWCNFGP